MSRSANVAADASNRTARPFVRVAVGLVLLTLVAYAPVFANGFVEIDDADYITANPPVQLGLTSESIRWAWTTDHHGYWHPLTWMSLQLDVSLFGYHAWGMHLTNLVLHVVVSVVLFFVFERMTGAFWPSAFLGALFAVHPLHVESVAWAAERKDVLSTFFLVVTLLAYVRVAERPTWKRHALTSAVFTLGLLAKPMLVTLPFALLLVDIWPLRRWTFGTPPDPRYPPRSVAGLLVEKIPLFVLAFAFSLVTLRLQKQVGAVVSFEVLPLGSRLANVLNGYVWYLWKSVVPTHLGVFHTHRWTIPLYEMILPIALLGAITVTLILCFRRHPELLVGWLWFGGTLFPVSGIVQSGSQAYADRFAYVPHIGLFIVFIWGSMLLAQHWCIPGGVLRFVAGAVLLACTGLTFAQVRHWHDAETLFLHTLSVEDDSRTHAMLGELYLMREDRFSEARTHLLKAIELDPLSSSKLFDELGLLEMKLQRMDLAEKFLREGVRREHLPDSRHNLALALVLQKKLAEAGDLLEDLLRDHPNRADSHGLLGEVRVMEGRFGEAQTHLVAALELKPDFPEAHEQLALTYLAQKQSTPAERHLREAVRLKPSLDTAWAHLAHVLLWRQDWATADRILRQALDRFPNNPVFLADYALALWQKGETAEAKALYQRVDAIAPNWIHAAAAEALRRSTDPNAEVRHGPRALVHALQAAQATNFRDPVPLESLAAAHAELGQFDQALTTVDQALRLNSVPADLADRLRAARQKYQAQEPLRQKGNGSSGKEGT